MLAAVMNIVVVQSPWLNVRPIELVNDVVCQALVEGLAGELQPIVILVVRSV